MSAPARPMARQERPTQPGALPAATWAVVAGATYGALKLWWALGGDLLKAQSPLPREAQQALLADDSATAVASHWVTVLLAAVGVIVAWSIGSGRTGERIGGLLRAGAWTVGGLMVVRAVGGFGFGFVGDASVLLDVRSVDNPRYAEQVAFWDLFLWSPYWLLFGLAWVALARAAGAAGTSRR